MKKPVFAFFVLAGGLAQAADPIDWSQPPVGCVEDIVPTKAARPCPDLSGLENPSKADDYPNLPEDELAYWRAHRGEMRFCRSKENLRRVTVDPNSVTPALLEISWMQISAAENRDQKIAAVYEASRVNKIPVQVLAGALYQESIFAELGVAEDGGNFSCGVGQINIQEWCRWAEGRSAALKAKLGWPAGAQCEQLPPALVAPFYEIAKTRLKDRPEYRMATADFENIPFEKVSNSFGPGERSLQKLRYAAARSFLQNCSNPTYGIAAKANELARLYREHIPAGLKMRDQYRPGEKFNRVCREEGYAKSYPLAVGWLLAVGAYNSGPRVVDALAYYNNWSQAQVQDPRTWIGMTPKKMIEGLYNAGKYDVRSDRTSFRNLQGGMSTLPWFKQCVLQRHVARVVQHSTLGGVEPIVSSLEGANKCAKPVLDRKTDEILRTSVPLERQRSAGHIVVGAGSSSDHRPRQ